MIKPSSIYVSLYFSLMPLGASYCEVGLNLKDETRRLAIGQSFDIEVNGDEEIRVNKRSQIIHTARLGEKHWRITALKVGFAIIEQLQFDGLITRRFLVHVRKIGSDTSNTEKTKVTKTIAGVFTDYREWLEQAKACTQSNQCALLATMSSDALQSLTKYLSATAPVVGIEHVGGVDLVLRIICTKPKEFREEERRIDLLLDNILEGTRRKVICFAPAKNNLKLSAKIVLIAKEHSDQFGIDLSKVDLFAPQPSWAKALHLNQHQGAMEIIAEPESRILPGTTTELLSGGELQDKIKRDFPESGIAAEEKTGWKLFGLQMIARVELVDDQQVMVNSDLRLSAPKRESELQSHRLLATFITKLGHSQFVGKTELQVDDQRDQGIFGLQSVPILGPLLRSKSQSKANHWLCYWIKVEKSEI